MRPVQIQDTVSANGGGITGSGTAAMRLLQNGFNVESLRTNALLRREEWIWIDRTVIDIARANLAITSLLLGRGLRTPLPNPLGHTRIEWQTMTDMTNAEITMSGISPAQNDRLEFATVGMPVPIIHKDFNLNLRHLAASRNTGQPIDTLQAQVASRKVAEMIEAMIVNGATVLGSNNTIYGLTTAPNRNTGSVTATWLTATGAQILADVLAMVGKAIADNMYGPYIILVPADVFVHLGDDFKANGDLTILQRILEIPQIVAVQPTTYLTAPNVVMFQLSADVIEIIDGFAPTTVEWESHGGFVHNFKVMAIMLPRVRNDADVNSGIVHYA
jgi:uncharacterized linocin/CFP29 family protein